MSYGYRRGSMGNQARLSEDEGDSWSEPMTISDNADNYDLGYVTTVEFDDGELLSVWYEKMAGSSKAVCARHAGVLSNAGRDQAL